MAPSTIKALLDHYREALLPAHGVSGAKAILREVFRERLGIALPELEPERMLSADEGRAVREPLERIRAGEPMQYVLGRMFFFGLRIAVDPRVLIPRPETEELVERIVRSTERPPDRIVDIGTGSGCIALALKKAFPAARVIGVDLSESALQLARANAAANDLPVEWHVQDALAPDLPECLRAESPGRHTLVVGNPPYVPLRDKAGMATQVVDHEPHTALFVPDDDPHLFYRAIARAAFASLQPGDALWFEAHHRHAAGTAAVVRAIGFPGAELLHDLSGNPRFIHAWK